MPSWLIESILLQADLVEKKQGRSALGCMVEIGSALPVDESSLEVDEKVDVEDIWDWEENNVGAMDDEGNLSLITIVATSDPRL